MSVIRVDHTVNYVVINKTVLEDPELSFKAKGLWAYCMSRPNNWEFHVSHLATISKDGEDAIYSALKELIEKGYVRKIQKNENGKFGKVDYLISEVKICLPHRDFPHAGNPALTSIDKELNNDSVCLLRARETATACEKKNSSVEKKDFKGTVNSYSKDDFIRYCVAEKSGFTMQEVDEAWKVLENYGGIVNDCCAFLSGTILNKRKKQKDSSWKTKQTAQTDQQSKQRSEKNKEKKGTSLKYADPDLAKRLFPD